MKTILESIDNPSQIKSLSMEQLRQLCSEIREVIVQTCAVNPGHLASSLGSVELIVGMHYVYDSPEDKFIFDVGHQAYAHKILTGRREAMKTLRQRGGISGFPNRGESIHDAFGVGHSSTSISAALGIAEAAHLQGLGRKVVALIGDGAMTGGLAFEGLNNAGISKSDLLVILNDNNQSIDGNLGAMHEHLLRITTNHHYNALKQRVWDIIGERNFRSFIQRWVKSVKSWFVKKSGGDLFEALGFRYFGPIDGNDIEDVVKVLEKLRDLKGPRILHCITKKGRGYAPAEADPVTWHAPGKFDPATGKRVPGKPGPDRYQDVFGEVLLELAKADPKVVGVTPAMAHGCGMVKLAEQCPEQFFDVGIEEEHAVTFSAGLAAGGLKPFCNIYSAFSQRAYDQIIHDVALQRLPVVLCFDRAGLVGEDGPTHHGAFDLAAYRSIPDLVVSSPKDEYELKSLMYSAYGSSLPFIIRYPRGCGEGVSWRDLPAEGIEVGKAETLLEGSDVALVCIGPVVNRALEVASRHEGKVGVFNFRFLKPFDEEKLKDIAGRYRHVVTVEDGSLKGGLYGAVCETLAANGLHVTVEGIGIPDVFVPHAGREEELSYCGINCDGIEKSLCKVFGK